MSSGHGERHGGAASLVSAPRPLPLRATTDSHAGGRGNILGESDTAPGAAARSDWRLRGQFGRWNSPAAAPLATAGLRRT